MGGDRPAADENEFGAGVRQGGEDVAEVRVQFKAAHGGSGVRVGPRGAKPVDMSMRGSFVFLFFFCLWGCAASPGIPDSGARDAGTPRADSGPSGIDAGPSGTDAGPSGTDAGPADAGPRDAGPGDAGAAPDAGPGDAGTDAGGPDCSPVDDWSISGTCPIPYGFAWNGSECVAVPQGCSCSGSDCERFLNFPDCEALASACGG